MFVNMYSMYFCVSWNIVIYVWVVSPAGYKLPYKCSKLQRVNGFSTGITQFLKMIK